MADDYDADDLRGQIEKAHEGHKLAKTSVGYEHPAQGPNHCGLCRHFEPKRSCEIVAGTIHREDWCRRFLKR